MIKFNRPFITGNEIKYISEAIEKGHLSGDGHFTSLCQRFFNDTFSFQHNYLTTSGSDALDMAAILADIKPGDEVIMPSFTFVSTANAFVLRGAKVIFADSLPDHPNIDHNKIEELITPATKAIVAVHYGGIACDMDRLSEIATKYNLVLIEDAAHSIDSYYKGKPLGGFGRFAAFSFHETKNIVSGEGGLLVVNDESFSKRAEIIREKGTNRASFFRGEIDKYGWVDIGSSFLPSEIIAAFLFAQLEHLKKIQELRLKVWNRYFEALQPLKHKGFILPFIPDFATNNAHLFYLLCPSLDVRSKLISHLAKNNIKAVFHYLPLHDSVYYRQNNKTNSELPHSVRYSDTLLRLPLYSSLNTQEQDHVIEKILEFANS